MQLPLTKSVELSNSHITQDDFVLLERFAADYRDLLGTDGAAMPVVLETIFGFVICIGSVTVGGIMAAGASDAFVRILRYCLDSHSGAILYLAFDRDGDVVEDLPTFEW